MENNKTYLVTHMNETGLLNLEKVKAFDFYASGGLVYFVGKPTLEHKYGEKMASFQQSLIVSIVKS